MRLVAEGVYELGPRRYQVRVRAIDPRTGRQVTRIRRIEGTKGQAVVAREDLRREVRGGAEERQRVLLADYAYSWLERRMVRLTRATAELYAAILEDHVLPELGQLYLDAITRADVELWLRRQLEQPGRARAKISKATVNGRLRVLRTVLADAADDYDISNPAARVHQLTLTARERRRRDGLELEELRALLEAAAQEPDWSALVHVLALTGMRWGEATALKWRDIDTRRGVIHVRRSHTGGRVRAATKSGGERWCPMPSMLAAELAEHRRRLIEEQHPGLAQGWVFATIGRGNESRLRYSGVATKLFRRLATAAGIERPVSPHDLRRTFVDALRLAGADAVVEHALAGHAGDEMREHYSTVRDGERAAVLERVVGLVFEKGDQRGD